MEIEVAGAPAHTRTLVVEIEQAAPQHARARGTILDLRKRGLVPMASDLQTAGVIHDMRVEAALTLDPPRIETLQARQPSVAFEPSAATDGESCRDPAGRLASLAGAPLDGDATRRLGDVYGGPLGCSHVLTLAQLLLSTARRALALEARRGGGPARPEGQRIFHRSLSIDGIADDARLHLVFQLADVHCTASVPGPQTDPLDRLASRLEVRAQAELELGSMKLLGVRCAERAGDRDTYYGEWRDRSERVADLAGRGAFGGLAPLLFERLGGDEADRPLLDTLLNLSPALIQCVPAVMERWHRSTDGARPAMMAGNGMADSCYMWRRDGAMLSRFEATERKPDA
jgi:hypothetical protein